MALILISPLGYAKSAPPKPDWPYVEKRLTESGLGFTFIHALKKNYTHDHFTQVLELNTLLFLKKSDYHGVQVNDDAVEDVRAFVKENKTALKKAEKTYQVPGEVVASLLWLESRHGKNLGNFHVPSVFVDLVQADRPEIVHYLHTAGKRFTKHLSLKDRQGITSRTKKRVKWAIAELKAIETMYKKNKKVMKDFNGSFAGAFGMPQFEPSSYVAYAKAQKKGHPPDLYTVEDSVHSVANYLHESGWRKGKDASFMKALMKYNNSKDYANAILDLAHQASPPGKERVPAGKKSKKKKNAT